MQVLRTADFFGVPFIQQIDPKQSIYKSAIGGLITLLICSASLAYAIWVLYQWQTNQLSPKISNSMHVSDFSLLDLNYDVIKLYYWKINENYIDPFESKILLPLVMYTTNFSFTELQVINMSNETTVDGSSKYLIPKMNLAFQTINGEIYTTSEMYIQIVLCSEKYLQPNEKCASQELVDEFFKQALNTVVMQVHYKTLDSKDGSEQTSLQEFYAQIEMKYCYTLSTFLSSNLYEVQDAFLFGNPKQVEYIVGSSIQSQTNTIEYCRQTYGDEVLTLFYILMKGSQTKTIFQYPTAGDLLANIGSIVSVLFMIKHAIILINGYQLKQKILKEVISFYYPEFKNISIIKNWKQKITKITLKEKELDIKEYKRFYKKIRNQMEVKLSYLNMLYEISRMYFIIRSSNLKIRSKEISFSRDKTVITISQRKLF
ncbi:unnamed protein product (macronuclear) [Paramecium tetraurelia]|uniref:Transmembrane protein n=1 Tax=Paramecium tetraurelia TaxID=5888 RepID=A0D2L9_PARTE|nr:uncharacterized protein GSPATT00012794001 [Paramecium tetraurelia]CAK77286.1 unnamed protein product [Paramecium tetraurelia]|eukprot:XP_001444683.1 hypothetical protein (macronuclear) [Paramecium tetraurelia strain d4-2]